MNQKSLTPYLDQNRLEYMKALTDRLFDTIGSRNKTPVNGQLNHLQNPLYLIPHTFDLYEPIKHLLYRVQLTIVTNGNNNSSFYFHSHSKLLNLV